MVNASPCRSITTPLNFIFAPLGTGLTRLAADAVCVSVTCATLIDTVAQTRTIAESKLKKCNLRTAYLLIVDTPSDFRETDACLCAPNRSGRLHGRRRTRTGRFFLNRLGLVLRKIDRCVAIRERRPPHG